MGRLLLVPVALLALLAGLAGVALAGITVGSPAAASLADPALAHGLRGALEAAGVITVVAVPLGFSGALALWGAGGAVRLGAAALAVLVVAVPGAGYGPVDFSHVAADRGAALALAACVARAAAEVLLLAGVGLARLPPGLRRAAMLAGATPGQAWRDAVLWPLWPYLLGGAACAFALALAEGPAGALLATHIKLAQAWLAPAALLLVLAALGALLRPRRASV